MAGHNTWSLILGAGLAFWGLSAWAEILGYQDASGLWHFTDRPTQGAVRIESYGQAEVRDLAAQLAAWRGPTSGSETSGSEQELEPALAVVSVRTPVAEGAGFFCSQDGYILTTRHLVRPVGSDAWQQGQAAIDQAQGGLDELEGQAREWRSRLARIDAQLGRLQASGDERAARAAHLPAEADAESVREKRAQVAQRVQELERLVRERRRQTRSDRVAFDVKSASATLAASVEIRLADQTPLRARVVAVSQAEDLALLKLDGYRTPALRCGAEVSLTPGQAVFALGHPDDSSVGVAPGMVLSASAEELVTSAQLVPGYSGGPMLDGSGRVVGVSALKRVAADEQVYAEGLGIAIPIASARREFRQLRPESASAGGKR